ncbi:ubiquinone biosynthesis monooxygenase COQ6, mitochondrial [Cylas formicarius]|uniref:ubiquinone biosynthesis monooxygenase COQ6, mitochondrial n=1 Tax=Cylas formicarius TaxID=197179 RepID=UPI0029585C80|nr:ubiquinone biosynthesis monooxygenase COQ6, mitochondrial [Cylas formicarius]
MSLIIFNNSQFLISSKLQKVKKFYSINVRSHFDIIIAGGGMVGTTLACALGKNSRLANKKVLLLEGSSKKHWKLPENYSNRVVSINPGTHKLLNDIGAWKFIEKLRFTAVKRLEVWDAISDAHITFGDSEEDNVSYVVENDVILQSVSEEIKNVPNVNVMYDSKVKKYDLPILTENVVTVTMDNDDVFTCELLLACDGVQSLVRKSMKTDYLSWSYNQMGVVATLKLSDEIKNEIAWQRFLPTGPIALLPLTADQSSLVWSTTPEQAKLLLNLREEEFVDELNKAIWQKYDHHSVIQQASSLFDTLLRFLNCPSGGIRQIPPKICGIIKESRAAFPLGFGHSAQYIGQGVALIGDAAHRVHPLAGQGVNLGFGDVVCLNEILGEANISGANLNDMSYLKDYETKRQQHNVPTMLAVESLHRLYNTEFTPVVLLRSLGLQATHVIEPLKKAIISQAAV